MTFLKISVTLIDNLIYMSKRIVTKFPLFFAMHNLT